MRKVARKTVDPVLEELDRKGMPVLDVIVHPNGYYKAYVIPYDDLNRLVNDWVDDKRVARDGVVYRRSLIAPLPSGGYVDMNPPECYVQSSATLIGILHDCWCHDVNWWDGSNSIEMVDDFVTARRIPDTVQNYQAVMDMISEL